MMPTCSNLLLRRSSSWKEKVVRRPIAATRTSISPSLTGTLRYWYGEGMENRVGKEGVYNYLTIKTKPRREKEVNFLSIVFLYMLLLSLPFSEANNYTSSIHAGLLAAIFWLSWVRPASYIQPISDRRPRGSSADPASRYYTPSSNFNTTDIKGKRQGGM
jgi:hypothetical protein